MFWECLPTSPPSMSQNIPNSIHTHTKKYIFSLYPQPIHFLYTEQIFLYTQHYTQVFLLYITRYTCNIYIYMYLLLRAVQAKIYKSFCKERIDFPMKRLWFTGILYMNSIDTMFYSMLYGGHSDLIYYVCVCVWVDGSVCTTIICITFFTEFPNM